MIEQEYLQGYTPEGYVKHYYPNVYIKDIDFLSRVFIDVNGLSSWREVASNLTDDQAYEDAAEWVYNESYYIEQKKKNEVASLVNDSQLDLFMEY